MVGYLWACVVYFLVAFLFAINDKKGSRTAVYIASGTLLGYLVGAIYYIWSM